MAYMHATTQISITMNTIKLLNRKLVKPCLPTPPHLKTYQFSFLDEFHPLTEVGFLLFYESKHQHNIDLEESLAKVLVQFYPLAGRLVLEDQIVDCNDEGAEFVEAEIPDVDLASLIAERDLENLYCFLPRKNHVVNVSSYPLLSIQVTGLKSGCLAIGISVSHKIFDGSSLATFLAAWSNASHPGKPVVAPSLGFASVFPGKKGNDNYSIAVNHADFNVISVKMFWFDKEAISRSRSSLRWNEGEGGKRVSRVRLVCALIARALIRLDRAKQGLARECLVSLAVSMRERTTPPLGRHACGNLVMLSVGLCAAGSEEIGELVALIGNATGKTISDCARMLSLGEERCYDVVINPRRMVSEKYRSGEANVVTFSDYSKFGLYEADFGWGKPVWASIAPQPGWNITVVMGDREGDGIEAWVHLEKSDMALFEQDEDIRLFAT